MVFWIGAVVIALAAAAATGVRLLQRKADPAWPTALGFVLAIVGALGAAVQATVASLEAPLAAGGVTAAASAPHGQASAGGQDDFDALVARLEQGLKEDDSDPDRWKLLARSYIALGRLDDAVKALESAIERTEGRDPGLLTEYGEAVIAAADGRVGEQAEAIFAEILTLRPDDPRARYYLALALVDKGDVESAIEALKALLASAPPDAPWRAVVYERLQELDPNFEPPPPPTPPRASAPPGPTPEEVRAAADMAPEDRAAMIQSMVDGLAERMRANPGDLQGWLRLANAYRVLGQNDKAADAMAKASDLAPDSPELSLQFAELRIMADDGEITAPTEAALAKVLSAAPDHPRALWRLGQAAARRGDVEEARKRFEAASEAVEADDPLAARIRAALAAL